MLSGDEFAKLVVLLLPDGAVIEGASQSLFPLESGLLLLLLVLLTELGLHGLDFILHLEQLQIFSLALPPQIL